jgi:MFS family permease
MLKGYLYILKDSHFTLFALSFVLTQMCATLMWVLLPVFAKTEYKVPENVYGWVPTTNALMVVFLQMYVTMFTRKNKPLPMMALGTFFYAIGVGSIALGRGIGGFWVSMVVMTIGELIAMPTASTYVAGLAPAEMRGRYMSVFSLTWNVAYGLAPRIGGNLYDYVSPQAPWIAGLLIGLISVLAYTALSRKWSKIIAS